MSEEPTGPQAAARHWYSAGVGEVAAASAFSDLGHEIGTSLLPTLVTSTLHAGAGVLGIIEGASDALVGLTKIVGGPLADDPGRRSRQATGGYLITAIASGALGAITAVWQAALLRAVAWSARGLRSPARDALLYDLVAPEAYGRAAGLERAGDNSGALIGPLLGAALVSLIGVRGTLYLSAIPGVLAAISITLAARHARRTSGPKARQRLRINVTALRRAGVLRVLIPVAAFELGNVAATLLILRASQLLTSVGYPATAAAATAILLYAAHNGAAMITAYGGGGWIDRRGPGEVLGAAALLYVAGYLIFAIGPTRWWLLLVAFVIAGCGIGLAEAAETTLVGRCAPAALRGSAFGVLGLTQAVGDLGASGGCGLLWAVFSPAVAMGYAAGWMVIALLCTVLVREHHGN